MKQHVPKWSFENTRQIPELREMDQQAKHVQWYFSRDHKSKKPRQVFSQHAHLFFQREAIPSLF